MVSVGELRVPRYGDAALADLVPSLLSALGAGGFANPLQIDPLARACLLVIDGLGWELLRAHADEAPFLANLARTASPLTAGFPATTAASLASLGTGLPPGEHGLAGYTMLLPGQDRPLNCLRWEVYSVRPPVDLRTVLVPEQVQPRATAFERAVAEGVAVILVGPAAFAEGGFTRAVLRGGQYRPAVTPGDLVVEAARALSENGRRLVYAYSSDLDTVGHVRGVASEAWRLQLAYVDRLAEDLANRLPDRAALVITGDHGMVDLQPSERIDIDDVPALAAGVRALAGEPRARYIHVQPSAEADVLATWREILGGRMWVLTREEAIATGWFGPHVLDHVRPRIGDIVAVARGAAGVDQRAVNPREARLVGQHGSVTTAEQLVPLLVVRR